MRIHNLIAALALSLSLFSASGSEAVFAATHKSPARAPVSSGNLQLFSTEASAHAHCPKDEVVWLNTNSGIYHEKGMRWYGRTRSGAYVCRSEADAAGDRDTRNGQ